MPPFVPDWRWLIRREDSPWYPSMRLFRQAKQDEWGPVVDRVGKELSEALASPEAPSAVAADGRRNATQREA